MNIQRYIPGEEEELWQLYHDTTRIINGRDYTPDEFGGRKPCFCGLALAHRECGQLMPR